MFTMPVYCWCICSLLPISHGICCLQGEDGLYTPWTKVANETAVHKGVGSASIPPSMSDTTEVVFHRQHIELASKKGPFTNSTCTYFTLLASEANSEIFSFLFEATLTRDVRFVHPSPRSLQKSFEMIAKGMECAKEGSK